jgi:hypothetical protein
VSGENERAFVLRLRRFIHIERERENIFKFCKLLRIYIYIYKVRCTLD